jgi:hypothetical protein
MKSSDIQLPISVAALLTATRKGQCNENITKIKYKIIRQTRLVYLLFIVELATCFDPAGSSSRLYVNQVMLKNCVHLWDSYLLLNWLHVSTRRGHHHAFM